MIHTSCEGCPSGAMIVKEPEPLEGRCVSYCNEYGRGQECLRYDNINKTKGQRIGAVPCMEGEAVLLFAENFDALVVLVDVDTHRL